MADNESIRVDDGSVVHPTESEEPMRAAIEHVLSEEAQAILDKILEKNVANFDRKTAGSVLTALMYNQMNDMLINACNQYSQNSAALKEYMRNYLPNFVDVHVPTDDGGEEILEGTIEKGVLDINLKNAILHITASAKDNLTELITSQIEAALEELRQLVPDIDGLTSFTKEELDALLDDGIIPDGEEETLRNAETRTFTTMGTFNIKGVARTVTLTEMEE